MNKKEKFIECCYFEESEKYGVIKCTNNAYGGGRGLCQPHFVNARYHIKKGHTTWEQLEKRGLCKKLLTQAEKNELQKHPHKSYVKVNRKKTAFDDLKNDF